MLVLICSFPAMPLLCPLGCESACTWRRGNCWTTATLRAVCRARCECPAHCACTHCCLLCASALPCAHALILHHRHAGEGSTPGRFARQLHSEDRRVPDEQGGRCDLRRTKCVSCVRVSVCPCGVLVLSFFPMPAAPDFRLWIRCSSLRRCVRQARHPAALALDRMWCFANRSNDFYMNCPSHLVLLRRRSPPAPSLLHTLLLALLLLTILA